MSKSITPVPAQVIADVDSFVTVERMNVADYQNREFFDSSGVWDLHDLARRIYAQGWSDGYMARSIQRDGQS